MSNEKSRYITTIDYIIHLFNLQFPNQFPRASYLKRNKNVDRRSSKLSNAFDRALYSSIWFRRSRLREISYVEWIGSFHSLALNKRTIYGATFRPSLVRDSSLRSSHLVVMPHLVGWGPPPSPGARIGAGVQFWMIGPAVVGCCAATGWRTSCGNRAIACLKFTKVFDREKIYRSQLNNECTEIIS